RQMRGLDQWREANRQRGFVILGEGEEGRIAPNVGRARGDLLACEVTTDRIVIVKNFQRRKAILANGLRNIAPALVALPTAQFVSHGSLRVEEGESPG